MPWIIGALALAGLAWFGLKGCNAPKTDVANEIVAGMDTVKSAATDAANAATTAATDAATAATDAAASAAKAVKEALPNGKEISFTTGSVEDNLVKFIKDGSAAVDKTKWFNMEGLNFDTGKATLQKGSETKLQNVADIMAAFPKVKIKIGGYTDNVGKAESNMKLSDARAKTVVGELVKRGVAADRLTSEGYGPEHPVADNATAEGKAKNRRIDVNITAK